MSHLVRQVKKRTGCLKKKQKKLKSSSSGRTRPSSSQRSFVCTDYSDSRSANYCDNNTAMIKEK